MSAAVDAATPVTADAIVEALYKIAEVVADTEALPYLKHHSVVNWIARDRDEWLTIARSIGVTEVNVVPSGNTTGYAYIGPLHLSVYTSTADFVDEKVDPITRWLPSSLLAEIGRDDQAAVSS